MRKKLEEKLQQEIIIYCNIYHFNDVVCIPVVNELARQSNKTILRGASDLIIALKSKTIYVENKTLTGSQFKEQKLFEKRVVKLNHKYYICRSLEQFKEILKENGIKPKHNTDK